MDRLEPCIPSPKSQRASEALLPAHQDLIEASAISPEVAAERGYRSVSSKGELEDLGFKGNQARVPALLIPIRDVHGTVATHQIRPDAPRLNAKGKAVKYETPAGSRMVLDVPLRAKQWLADPKRPLFITEGARKADAGVSAGLCTIALLGVWNWRGTNAHDGKTVLADWESIALEGREVFIVFDSDVTTKPSVRKALDRLKAFLESRRASVRVINLPSGPDGAKVGLDDYLAAGHSAKHLLALAVDQASDSAGIDRDDGDGGDAGAPTVSQADLLVSLASGDGVQLFHASGGHDADAFATIVEGDHRRTWKVASKAFRHWLVGRFLGQFEKVPGNQAVQDALNALAGLAIFKGPEHAVALRLAEFESAIWLDLGDEEWRAVQIDDKGWRVVPGKDVPVRFVRKGGMRALSVPVRGGSILELRDLVNLPDESSWVLFVSCLVAYFRPTGPYPVLVVNGEQGSAKTWLCRIVRALIDPNTAPLRRPPKDDHDLMIAATNGWVIAFDNLSGVSQSLSDAVCMLATGGGFGARTLYTDGEETLFEATRPVLLNGIDATATRSDLIDRSIMLLLPTIPDDRRLDEDDLRARFEKAKPGILGALLDAVAVAIRNRPSVRLERMPRMADFAQWATAAESAFDWKAGTVLDCLMGNRDDANSIAIEASAIGPALIAHMDGRPEWKGTAGDLLSDLDSRREEEDRAGSRSDWPKRPHLLSAALRRLAPNLRRIGIEVAFSRKAGGNRERLIWLRNTGAGQASQASQASQTGQNVAANPVEPGRTRDALDQSKAQERPAVSGHFSEPCRSWDARDARDAESPVLPSATAYTSAASGLEDDGDWGEVQ